MFTESFKLLDFEKMSSEDFEKFILRVKSLEYVKSAMTPEQLGAYVIRREARERERAEWRRLDFINMSEDSFNDFMLRFNCRVPEITQFF